MKAEEEVCRVKYASQEANEHYHMQLKAEEGVSLSIESRRRAEEEELGLKVEMARLKYEEEEQARLKAEE